MEDHERLMAALKVTSPLVVLLGHDQKHHYLYEGAVLEPSLFDSGQIAMLLKEGLVSGGQGAQPEPAVDATPSGNASLEAWQEYARTQGASDDDLDGLSRNDLRDKYSD